STDGMLLRGGDRLRAAADNDFGPAKRYLSQQRLQPRFEFVIEIIHEDDTRLRHRLAVGKRRLIELGVATWPKNGDQLDVIASHVRDHVTDDAERCDDQHLVCGATGKAASVQHHGGNDGLQADSDSKCSLHRLPPLPDFSARAGFAPISDKLYMIPPASTIAGPDGRLS